MGARYSQLTPYERGQIDLLHRQETSAREIALRINRSHRTVSREIRRNSAEQGYVAETAEQMASARQTESCFYAWWKLTMPMAEKVP